VCCNQSAAGDAFAELSRFRFSSGEPRSSTRRSLCIAAATAPGMPRSITGDWTLTGWHIASTAESCHGGRVAVAVLGCACSPECLFCHVRPLQSRGPANPRLAVLGRRRTVTRLRLVDCNLGRGPDPPMMQPRSPARSFVPWSSAPSSPVNGGNPMLGRSGQRVHAGAMPPRRRIHRHTRARQFQVPLERIGARLSRVVPAPSSATVTEAHPQVGPGHCVVSRSCRPET
jgi:hypothetical protein